jgi:hypothetical protein
MYLFRYISKKSKVYYYHFDHLGSFSMADLFLGGGLTTLWIFLKKFLGFHSTKGLGVSHADDILYLFQ